MKRGGEGVAFTNFERRGRKRGIKLEGKRKRGGGEGWNKKRRKEGGGDRREEGSRKREKGKGKIYFFSFLS